MNPEIGQSADRVGSEGHGQVICAPNSGDHSAWSIAEWSSPEAKTPVNNVGSLLRALATTLVLLALTLAVIAQTEQVTTSGELGVAVEQG